MIGYRLPRCRWFILVEGFPGVDNLYWLQVLQVSMIYFFFLVAGFPGVDDLFWFQAVQVSIIYFCVRLPRCRWFILIEGCTGVDDLFWLQASQVSMIHFGCRLPRCRWFILVAGFPGVDDSFWLQASQVPMIYFGFRLPRCRWFILVAGFPGVDDEHPAEWVRVHHAAGRPHFLLECKSNLPSNFKRQSHDTYIFEDLHKENQYFVHMYISADGVRTVLVFVCFHEINSENVNYM